MLCRCDEDPRGGPGLFSRRGPTDGLRPRRRGTRNLAVVAMGLCLAVATRPAPGSDRGLGLPAPARWVASGVEVAAQGAGIELRLTRMFEPGGITSPMVPVALGDRLTLSAIVATEYRPTSGYYFLWLELEFLDGDRIVGTVRSSPIRATAPERVLAVTGIAPERATSARASIRVQNRISRVVPNLARVSSVALTRLAGKGSGPAPRLGRAVGFPDSRGPRMARIQVAADWPDGTAVAISSTRGAITPSVVLAGGRGEAILNYRDGDIGGAEISAEVGGRGARLVVPDPRAGRLVLQGAEADGIQTPVLVQILQNGKVRAGRYQSISGEFAEGGWSIELAPGEYLVRITRGPMFAAIEQPATIRAGGEVDLGRPRLSRQVDLRRFGWYGGDPDGDVYHGQRIYNDVDAGTAARIARAVGLDWITPANWGEPDPKTWGDARAVMSKLSGPDLLFRFADEKKWHIGHFCFVGLDRPDGEGFGDFWSILRRLNPSEGLQAVRTSGAATFANHPVRYWMSGIDNQAFVTNMYANLPLDAVAGGLLDGVNVNEGGEPALRLWSMLQDHGYRLAATAGADFSLDHPGGWLPGLSRLYVHVRDGLDERAIVRAIREARTIVSTGPMLVATIDEGRPPGSVVASGRSHRITARAWARCDQDDRLERVELWAHGRAVETRRVDGTQAEASFDWGPTAEHDWTAVRLVARSGWALTSAFHASAPGWTFPTPVQARTTVTASGLTPDALRGARIEVWDNRPDAPGARATETIALGHDGRAQVDAPMTATVRILLADGRRRDVRIFDASGASAIADRISKGAEKEAPLLRWETYEEVLRRCRAVTIDVRF